MHDNKRRQQCDEQQKARTLRFAHCAHMKNAVRTQIDGVSKRVANENLFLRLWPDSIYTRTSLAIYVYRTNPETHPLTRISLNCLVNIHIMQKA